jgi:hypothetical protein
MLVEDRTLSTLAMLNVTSRSVYQETLPELYEKMELNREAYLTRIVRFKRPRG